MVLDSSGNLGIGTLTPEHRLQVDGVISASSNISASAFYGDGSNLENVIGTITALNNQTENRLVTIGATTTELDGEAGLTFDGSTLGVSGDILVSDTNADHETSPTVTLRSTDNGHINDGATLRFDRLGPITTGKNLGELYWYGS